MIILFFIQDIITFNPEPLNIINKNSMNNSKNLLKIVKDYIKVIENNLPAQNIKSFYHPEAKQVEYPNMLLKTTCTRSIDDVVTAMEKGKHVLQKQTYEIVNSYEMQEKDVVIIEAIWRGTLAIPLMGKEAGAEMTAFFAQFYQFKDGKIIHQRNYDCFESLA